MHADPFIGQQYIADAENDSFRGNDIIAFR
jgi:hypothetical protein